MNTQDLDPIVRQIVDRLKQLPISRVILFGSSAIGATTVGSDIDIAVVLEEPVAFENYDQRLETKSRIRQSILDINRGTPIDIVLYTQAEYEDLLRYKGFLSTEVVAKGRTVYERAG